MDDNISRIIAAAVGGFFGWVFIQTARYVVLRHRLTGYVDEIIRMYGREQQNNLLWLKKTEKRGLRAGAHPGNRPEFTPNALEALLCMRDQWIFYLKKTELGRLVRWVESLFELESLYANYAASIRTFYDRDQPLTQDEYDHLVNRGQRIEALYQTLFAHTTSIKTLPELADYGPGVTPESLVLGARTLAASSNPPSSVPIRAAAGVSDASLTPHDSGVNGDGEQDGHPAGRKKRPK